jgi:hypothetical protein
MASICFRDETSPSGCEPREIHGPAALGGALPLPGPPRRLGAHAVREDLGERGGVRARELAVPEQSDVEERHLPELAEPVAVAEKLEEMLGERLGDDLFGGRVTPFGDLRRDGAERRIVPRRVLFSERRESDSQPFPARHGVGESGLAEVEPARAR